MSNELKLPAFKQAKESTFVMDKIVEAERRILEARTVTPLTYVDLESCFNESYRDLKRHLAAIGFLITQAEKAMEVAKSDVILDTYPQYLIDNNIKKTNDNADMRKAFLMRDPEYLAALDRYNQLKALENNFDGKIKVMENVCRYMRKQMDLLLRGGVPVKIPYNSRNE